jgi:glycosyltransferase involved in cell wall biosynthesis
VTKSRLHIDITSCWERRGHPVGISRVVTELARTVRQLSEHNRAWRYDRRARVLRPVTWQEFDVAANGVPGPGRRRGAAMSFIGKLPLAHRVRERIMAVRAGLLRLANGRRRFPAFCPEDMFIFADWISEPERLALYEGMLQSSRASTGFYCHDTIPLLLPDFVEPGVACGFRRSLSIFLRPGSTVICNSRSTLADLRNLLPTQRILDDALVIPPGSDLAPGQPPPDEPCKELDLRPGYILYVSTIEVRKNHRILIEAYERLAADGMVDLPTLVFVGKRGWMVDSLLKDIDSGMAAGGRARLLDQVSDVGLRWLYENASFTVYPSFYEGWGIPVSEALNYGKFCLCSDRGALPEAGGAFVELLDPSDCDTWAERIRYYLLHPGALEERELAIRMGYRPRLWADFREEAAAALSNA